MTYNKNRMDDRKRNWCFTAYNEPQFDYECGKANFCTFQRERGHSKDTLHWQGYVEFVDKISMEGVKKFFGDETLHLEPRYGSAKQAVQYCQKEDTRDGEIIEFGILKNQGKRIDIDEIWDDIEEGFTAREILISHKGRALKYVNMISKGLRIFHEVDLMDKIILDKRNNFGDLEDPLFIEMQINKKEAELNEI